MNNFTQVVRKRFQATVENYNLLSDADCVVVGFSGGADSVCLLHLLETFREAYNYKIKAVHVNHGIRGDEAHRDEIFAENFCAHFSIPFIKVHVNCIEEAEKTKETLEECGRRLRYKAFAEYCTENSKIATAHNANDNVETVIFNMARGTSLKGLRGIPFKRDNIVRPILDCSREEIEGYCLENGLSFVTDSTNLSDDYTRNKIRHNILPVLGDLNPSFIYSFSSLSEIASDVSDYLDGSVSELIENSKTEGDKYSRESLISSHKAVLSEFFVRSFNEFSGKSLEGKKVKDLHRLLCEGGRLQLYGNYFAEVKKDYFRYFIKADNDFSENKDILTLPFSDTFNGFSVEISEINEYSKIVNHFSRDNMIDCEKVVGKLFLRTRNPGDSFTFHKRKVTKTLKKLFNETDIPLENREKIPVLADDNGVVWVYGFGTTERCYPHNDSHNIILVRGEDNDRKDYD